MSINRAVIVVCEDNQVNARTFHDACSLAKASSESVTVVGPVPENVKQIARTQGVFKGNDFDFLVPEGKNQQPDLQAVFHLLDRFSLETDLLVVSIGNSANLNLYISARLESETKKILQWHVVSSNYARYALLEQQRSLSAYIPKDTGTWVRDQVARYGRHKILSSLDGLSSLKALVIGETILDEYVYCNALGKVSKDPLVAFEVGTRTIQLGGILAIAKHMAGLGASVSVRSKIGRNQRQIVKDGMPSSVDLSAVFQESEETLKKTRYVDRGSNVRVFETYDMPIKPKIISGNSLIEDSQASLKADHDLAIVVDYGHDLIDESMIKGLLDSGIYLAANAQSNAGNRGFNPISRYRGAPMIFLNGSEVEVETRLKSKDLVSTVEALGLNLETQEFFVTNGSGGLICWEKGLPTISVPAFAPSVVDRTGAGDALLSTTALLRKSGVPREIAAFFGNISGAMLISSMGNETSLTHESVRQAAEEIIDAVTVGVK